MPVIFASPDIAAIVAAFPPPSPIRGQVTLLRSASGERLLNSKKVLDRLDRLLVSSKDRLPIASLSSALDVRTADLPRLLSTHDKPLHYSKERSHLLPESEANSLLKDLSRLCHSQSVDLAKWSRYHDVSSDLMTDLDLKIQKGDDGASYLYHQSLADETKTAIVEELGRARPEKCDLSDLLPDIHFPVLRQLATDVAADTTMRVSVECSRTTVFLVPDEWQDFQQQRRGDQARARIERVVDEVRQTGFATVDEESGDDDIVDELSTNDKATADFRLTTFRTAKRVVVMRHNLFDEVSGLISASAKSLIRDQWAAKEVEPSGKLDDSAILATLERLKAENPTHANGHSAEVAQEFSANHGHGYSPEISRELCSAILESSQRKSLVDETAKASIDALVHEEKTAFSTLVQDAILSPLYLYETGLKYIQDEALRERNAALALQLVLKDHVRPAMTQIKERRLCHDRRRLKDVQTFTSAFADEIPTLDSLSAAAKTLQKKQSVASPTTKQLQEVQVQVLQKATKALTPNKSRDSDILQHFLWVQFAHHVAHFSPQEHPALFVSGGKDTTRMIKALRALTPSSDGVQRLESFCEGLKKGTAGTMEGYVVYGVAQRNVEDIMALWGYDVDCPNCKMYKTRCVCNMGSCID